MAGRALGVGLLAAWVALAVAPPAEAQVPRAERSYPVSAFLIEYPLPHPAHPPLAELLALEVELRITRGGLMPPHPATRNQRFRLGEVPPGTRFWASGLRHVSRQILAEFERRGIGGVIVTLPDLEEGGGDDLRAAGETRLRLRVWTGRVENIATLADGDRFRGSRAARTNRPEHRFIRDGSPVRAGGERGLIRTREIEDYARRLSRHPGRRVDAKLRPGELPGATRLDYHVAEHKPWTAYAQIANNGTDATTETRERFGISHNQLTGNDDILRLDYLTGDFDEVHAVFGSYEAPVFGIDALRWRAFGSYSEYDASEVGVSRLDFSGDTWEGGGRLIANVLQLGPLFVDVFGGARWRHVGVENRLTIVGGEAQDDFFLPEGGLALSFEEYFGNFDLEASLEANLPDVASTDAARLFELGRVDPRSHFEIVRWNGRFSFYLEPILLYRRGWGDPGSPARSTLAHEVVIQTRGGWSLDDRLVPQFQQVAGGMYTVRGYEQSEVASDRVAIGSVEYRLHLARLIDPGGESIEVPVLGPFQLRPTSVFTRPDWDVVLKIFADGALTKPVRSARVRAVNRIEQSQELAGWGIGVEVQLLRNFRAGLDMAWARSRIEGGRTRAGDSPEFHAVATILF